MIVWVPFRNLTFAGVLSILCMTILSSWYDAVITCEITKPLEKYVVATISEVFNRLGFKFHSTFDPWEMDVFKLSLKGVAGEKVACEKSTSWTGLRILLRKV